MAAAVYQFGDFRLDCGRFELLRKGRTIRLERKPMELLILLLGSEGRLVTRNEIAGHLWSSEVFVDTEHGINTAIRKIRQVLGDDPENPRFIQTVASKGYRFSAPILSIAPPESPPEPAPPASSLSQRKPVAWYIAAGACVLCAIGGTAFYRSHHRPPEITYTQLTDFTDSAVAPALSPDGWSTSGRFLFIRLAPASRTSPGRSLAIPVGPDESLPHLPPRGVRPQADLSVVKGSQLIPRSDLVPGNDPSHFAYVNSTVHRNLYRISLP